MAFSDIDSAITTDLQNKTTDYTAGEEPWNKNDDGFLIENKETESYTYQCDWIKWHGMYRAIPEIKATTDKLAIWVMGKGYKADDKTKEKLNKIRGFGKDTFNSILFNQIRTYKICGDSFAEKIKNKRGELINLKPLDPGTIKIWADNKGIIGKYEQVAHKGLNTGKESQILATWKADDILHLSNGRIADEIHGIPSTEKLQKTVKRFHQAMADLSVVFHRYVKPLLVSTVNTDNANEIAAYKSNLDNAVKNMENLIVPKGTVEGIERVSIPQFSTLNPLPWIQFLQTYFITSEGIPQIILGEAGLSSEATSKIIYLAFQQTIEWEQLYIEEQVKAQLGMEIKLDFPASIDPSLLTDARKNKGDKVTDNNPNKVVK